MNIRSGSVFIFLFPYFNFVVQLIAELIKSKPILSRDPLLDL